jgi:hypothetical protein
VHARLYREGENPSDAWMAKQMGRATWSAPIVTVVV